MAHMLHFLMVHMFLCSSFFKCCEAISLSGLLILVLQNFSLITETSIEVCFDSLTGQNVWQQLIMSGHIKDFAEHYSISKGSWSVTSEQCLYHFIKVMLKTFAACNYMFKVNNRSNGTRCEICSKLTIKTPERSHLAYFEHISHLALVFL